MKRWVVVLGVSVVLQVILVSIVWANGGPHGGYTTNTDSCAGCHRAHTAVAPQLLVGSNTGLCLTCHGSGTTGANTNVWDGVYTAGRGGTGGQGTDGYGLLGGGFSNVTRVDPGLTGTPITTSVTSRHSVQGMGDYSSAAIMWGAGPISGTTNSGTAFDLYCTSCHDPHGSPNYRLLNPTINGTAVTVSQTDETTKSYTSPTYYKASGTWEISTVCAACHTRYMATASGNGTTTSGDAVFAYRHRIDVQSGTVLNGTTYSFQGTALPFSSTGGAPTTTPTDNRVMTCLACHYAHGTGSTMGARSGSLAWPGGATTPSGNARSSLLRLNNRGICENCHNK